jgi:hypothetical protein
MIVQKNELRIQAQARKGTVSHCELVSDPGFESALDKEIILCASKCLKGRKLTTFYFVYQCQSAWSDIQMLYKTHLNLELDSETVQRYWRDAVNRIVDSIQ